MTQKATPLEANTLCILVACDQHIMPGRTCQYREATWRSMLDKGFLEWYEDRLYVTPLGETVSEEYQEKLNRKHKETP